MPDISAALAENRAAVAELIAAAEGAESTWSTPRAPGKWSPSQLTEHVARSMEESANVVAGAPSKFPTFPFFVRPLVRGVFFNRVLKKNAFPKAKTPKPFDPDSGPASPGEARTRLEAALADFERECSVCAEKGGTVKSTIFGDCRSG